MGCMAGTGTMVDADVDAVSRGGMSAVQSCVWNCMELRSMIRMWQISKYTSTRLRANLVGEGQAQWQKSQGQPGCGQGGWEDACRCSTRRCSTRRCSTRRCSTCTVPVQEGMRLTLCGMWGLGAWPRLHASHPAGAGGAVDSPGVRGIHLWMVGIVVRSSLGRGGMQ